MTGVKRKSRGMQAMPSAVKPTAVLPLAPYASLLTLLVFLSGCGSAPMRPADVGAPGGNTPAPAAKSTKPAPQGAPAGLKKGGGYYLDDGPGDNPPPDMAAIPDAVPRLEPLHKFANKPYSVLGKDYAPLRAPGGYKASGVASWYGRKFHGQKTSSGEYYDMYGMTAAHPILPIPSYVRVSNASTGKSVVVRVNDRGPFHADRIIDLSYTAAWKLGLVGNGSGRVTVESIVPGDTSPAPAEPTYVDPGVVLAAVSPPPLPDAVTPATPTPTPPSATATSGAFVQLGAFGAPENAEAFRAHLSRELDWVADKLRTEVAGKFHRVQLGPYASRGEAEDVAARIASALGVKPSIVMRP